MRFRHRLRWASNAFDDNGFRTSWTTAVGKGILLPLPLVFWAGRDAWHGNTHWGRGQNVTDDPWIVGGFIAIKLGIAAAWFIWYFLANSPRFDRWIHALLLPVVGIAALGLVSVVYGSLF